MALLSHFGSYHVLLGSQKYPEFIFGIFSSILITYIFTVMVNSASKRFFPQLRLSLAQLSPSLFWTTLIYLDNFYFHCHGQFSLYNFSITHPRTHAHLENSHIEVGRAHLKMERYQIIFVQHPNTQNCFLTNVLFA